ncbi:MAG: hypothetical protein U0354_09850 [Candidatus Sericytochromatia bacterium]
MKIYKMIASAFRGFSNKKRTGTAIKIEMNIKNRTGHNMQLYAIALKGLQRIAALRYVKLKKMKSVVSNKKIKTWREERN